MVGSQENMARAHINISMLDWARERSGVAVPEFARKCGVSIERLGEWESGERDMTFLQAQMYADKAHIPFGYLFLPCPPNEELPLPDLRTVDGKEPIEPSAELMDMVKIILQRQDWYKEYLKLQYVETNPVVGLFSVSDGVDRIVSSMRVTLGVPDHPNRGKWQDYYRELVEKIESVGIMVMREGYIGHHTRALSVEEFRGFAIADELAPAIFVNHADSLGARLFTLIHELCHIWIGQSGISDGNAATHREDEILCNAVAAEFLVPSEEFVSLWQESLKRWEDNFSMMESHFHVSTWVLARRALTLNKISQDMYQAYIADQQATYRKQQTTGGPTYYKTKKAQLSALFSRAVVTEALNGHLLLREAGQLLGGIKPGKIETFAKELGV